MKKLKYGQIGGTLNAFIGDVHRRAIAFDGLAELAAGCFSVSNPKANTECGNFYSLSPDRVYSDYSAMLLSEKNRCEDRLDFVVICTPNNTHYEIAKAFLENGFNVVCEKPLCFSVAQAEELQAIAERNECLTAVTYTYIGYNMVKQARQMIAEGIIGRILDVKGEYLQDWLLDKAYTESDAGSNIPVWRMDPKVSGISNCVGDIGTHIEQTVAFTTGLRIKRLCAVLDNFSQKLDLNSNILVEFEGGVHGSFCSSQVCAGHYNGLVIRIFGTEGAIEWEQEHPDTLKYTPKGKPTQVLTRAAHTWGLASEINRFPSGHPEGITIAFANIYRSFAQAVSDIKSGAVQFGELPAEYDFPTIADGIKGVKFIEACVKSNSSGSIWVDVE